MQLVAGIVLILVGLVIVIYILVTKFRFFGDVDMCEKRGYVCKEKIPGCAEGIEYAVPFPCPQKVEGVDYVCCASKPSG
ncbi:MAG: hypothetical protein KJ574_04740 [Nanoarchaeota archaeon]|nr:hypothetical protein [Nanoarchaeota archaeon]